MAHKKRKQASIYSPDILFDDDELDQVESTTTVDAISSDGRRISTHHHPVYTPASPTRPTSRLRGTADASATSGESDVRLDDDSTIQIEPPETSRGKRKNLYYLSSEQDSHLVEWTKEIDFFLREMIWLEGLRGVEHRCEKCKKSSGISLVRCKDCIGGPLYCTSCCVQKHAASPFHSIEHWNGRYFEKTNLRSIGLTIQLGHRPGVKCPNPIPGPIDFVVLHTNGLHPVEIHYCGCQQLAVAGTRLQQLLRCELFPATVAEPTTAATFRVMEQFHILTLQGKLTGYDFYLSLEYLSNNTGLGMKSSRLKSFMRMVREWRHLKALKRAGRGHDGGVRGTQNGALCVRCPACPRPGFNLPDNWHDAPDDQKYIYTMILAIDANFRLKRRAVSSNERDPALGSGWGYFVTDEPYREHVLQYANQEDISNCTGFAAISQANTKFSKGYAVTGIGSMKGERYCNIDYIVISALKALGALPPLVLSYDIVCQWAIYFFSRISTYPEHLQIKLDAKHVRYAIPMYHFRAHKEKDHNKYSLHLMEGVGRSCGESIERNWPKHEETAASTREMGPGSRHDTLEDHFGYANWRVYTSLGSLFHRQLAEALRERQTHQEIYQAFSEKLLPSNVKDWIAQAEAYERDRSLPDPYYREPAGITEADIRMQLAEEDDQAIAKGEHSAHDVTPAAMLVDLLEIEELQQKYGKRTVTPDSRTPTQTAELIDKRATIRRRLLAVREIQAIYMSCVPQMLARYLQSTPHAAEYPEEQNLYLPSSLSPEELQGCKSGISALEERLRDAQLYDSLDRLRVHLHIRSRLAVNKARNVRHQGANTRARRKIDVNESKIGALADKYRAARRAKLSIAGPGDWEKQWRVLDRSDVRTLAVQDNFANMTAEETVRQISEGRRTTSWIWMTADSQSLDTTIEVGMQEALRIEFLRTRARSRRWSEQVALLEEEQRRTLVSLEGVALEWDRRMLKYSGAEDAYSQGLAAYAAEQAAVQRGLKAKYRALWSCAVPDNECAVQEGDRPINLNLEDSEEELEDEDDPDE
ncbi:hypothetical protein EIP86_007009 [Pleurotus ostreatoroseus]|nr:hypothetical protein EIP86_007009 [Pleurotus ostreatoroseus]